MNLTLTTDRQLVRATGGSTRYLHLSFTAPAAPRPEERRPVTAAFVLDRSGSMRDRKLALAKKAVLTAIDMLQPADVFAVVVYDDEVDVVVPATAATPAARRQAVERLAAIDARSMTDLAGGWMRGCDQVADGASRGSLVRCLLLSDGLANRGITDHAELASRAGQLRSAYVVTSTFGVGADFDEPLMKSMARMGGGNFYYIEDADGIERILTSELGETLEVVARNAVVELELPPGVTAEVMQEFRGRQEGARLRVELDDLVSEQDVSLFVKLCFPTGREDERLTVRAALDAEERALEGSADIVWTFAADAVSHAQARERRVDRLVAEVYAARARRDAVEHNRRQDFRRAERDLTAMASRIEGIADNDPQMIGLAVSLREDSVVLGRAMDATPMKRMHHASSSMLRMRDASGSAIRRPLTEELRLEELDGHLVFELPDRRRFLMDTGSPVSIGEGGPIQLLTRVFPVERGYGSVTVDRLRGEIRARIDGLAGMDVFGALCWTLDAAAGTLTISRRPALAGTVAAVRFVGGVPTIPIQVGGEEAEAFLDTAAWLSYMPPEQAAGAASVGSARDFLLFPEPVRFETSLHERTIRLGGVDVTSAFGVLPPHLPLAAAVGHRWIIGAQLLAQRTISYDPEQKAVIFKHGMASQASRR